MPGLAMRTCPEDVGQQRLVLLSCGPGAEGGAMSAAANARRHIGNVSIGARSAALKLLSLPQGLFLRLPLWAKLALAPALATTCLTVISSIAWFYKY